MPGTEPRPCREALRGLLARHRHAGPPPAPPASHPAWAELRLLGTRVWLDTGDLEGARALWAQEMEALTTNNTLLNAEVQKGLYDAEIPEAARALREAEPGLEPAELVREISLYLNARHGLKLVAAFDALVSVELHTDLAHDLEQTVATGTFLHELCPSRFVVKVPLTPAGILATRRLALHGVPVNHTLGFSARQNLLVAAVARPAYVNVFMGRLGAWVAENGLGDGRNVGERATVASQRELLALRNMGWPTLQIGASIRDGSQVAALAGLDVHTIPLKAARQYLKDWGELGSCLAPEREFPVRLDPALERPAACLWEVDEEFREALLELGRRVTGKWSPADLAEALERIGAGALMPAWTEQERKELAAGGKLPAWPRWREELARGEKGLDALFTEAGLLSFAADQAALDGRVARLLA